MAESNATFARSAFELRSPRLVIRTPTMADAQACLQALTNPANFPFGHPPEAAALQLDDLAGHMDGVAENTASGKNAMLIFVLRDSGEMVGYGAYNGVGEVGRGEFLGGAAAVAEQSSKMADVGVVIDSAYRRHGYALEAFCALVDYARSDMGCGLFRAETEPANDAWRALMRKTGLGPLERPSKASFESTKDVLAWKFDAAQWDSAKASMQAAGKWPL